jgi:hypothetical protein
MWRASGTTPSRWAGWHDRGVATQMRGVSLPDGQDRLQFSKRASRHRLAPLAPAGARGRGSVVEHHLAKVRVAGSNPVVRSELPVAVTESTVRTALR